MRLVKGRDLGAEEAVLVALPIVSQVDTLPEAIVEQQEALTELCAVLSRAGRLRGSVFEYDLRLREMPCQRCAGAG